MPLQSIIHLYTVLLGLCLQPISTATSNIGLGIAIGGSVPLLIANPRLFAAPWNQPWLRWLLAWLVLSWLSLLWSSDARFGVEQFRACRVLVWIPLLWPARNHWLWLVAALLTGTTMLQMMQATQMSALAWPASSRFGRGHGLTSPTQTGLWDAISLSFLLLFAVMGGWRRALAFLPLSVLAATGLVWSATRASVIGVAVELVVAGVVLACTSKGWIKRALVRCVVGLVILGGVSLVARSQLQAKFDQAIQETKQTVSGNGPVNSEFRLAMWRMTLDGWRKHSILGVGIGGIPKSIAENSTEVSNGIPLNQVRMIHSTYIQVLAETGLVGALLFAGFMISFFRRALAAVREDPVRITAFGACVVWFVAAAFDGYQQSGGFLTVGAICMALAAMPTATDPARLEAH